MIIGMLKKRVSKARRVYLSVSLCPIALLLVIALFLHGAFGQQKTDVTMRFSKQEQMTRLVFEAPQDAFITNTLVSVLEGKVKIEFPSPVNLKPQSIPDLTASLKGSTYLIDVQTPFTVKTLKLSNPPRLSVDIVALAKEEPKKPGSVTSPAGPATDALSGLKVVIDAGHGGYDIGIVSHEMREKDITLTLARDLEAMLTKKTKGVFLTRKADQYLSIQDRALSSHQKSADIFISLHLSQSDTFVFTTSLLEPTGPDLSPAEVYGFMQGQRRSVEKSKRFAEEMSKAIQEEFKMDTIHRKMNLPVINAATGASLLLEFPKTMVYDQTLRKRIAQTLAKGISAYAGRE